MEIFFVTVFVAVLLGVMKFWVFKDPVPPPQESEGEILSLELHDYNWVGVVRMKNGEKRTFIGPFVWTDDEGREWYPFESKLARDLEEACNKAKVRAKLKGFKSKA